MSDGSRLPWRRQAPGAPVPGMTPQRAALEEERRRLAEQVAERTWDLGGLAYEMAVRDHFRVDVLSRRAAELQRIDAQLSEVERLVADHAGIAGNCRFCGSPHGRSAEFCWSCGERLIVRQAPDTIEGTAAAGDAPTREWAAASAAPADEGATGAAPDGPTREWTAGSGPEIAPADDPEPLDAITGFGIQHDGPARPTG